MGLFASRKLFGIFWVQLILIRKFLFWKFSFNSQFRSLQSFHFCNHQPNWNLSFGIVFNWDFRIFSIMMYGITLVSFIKCVFFKGAVIRTSFNTKSLKCFHIFSSRSWWVFCSFMKLHYWANTPKWSCKCRTCITEKF